MLLGQAYCFRGMRKFWKGSAKKKTMCPVNQKGNIDSDMEKEAGWSWEEC